MCLAIPGKILSISEPSPLQRVGKVDFAGVSREVSLALLPEAGEGDYVLVHAGLAIGKIDEDEALEVFGYLRQLGVLEADGP